MIQVAHYLPRMGVVLPAVLCAALSLSGCSGFEKTPLGKHATEDQKVAARQKWDAVRGDVKLQIVRQQLDTGRLDDAQKHLESVLATSPPDARPYLLATRLRLEQGRLADARSAIIMAQQLAPTDGEVLYYAGIVAQRYGELDSALAHYEAASAASSNNAAYVLAHAETLAALGRTSDALALIESRLSDFDEHVPLRVLAARIARLLALKAPTVQYLREALQLAKGDRLLTSQAAESLVWAGACAEAIDLLLPIVESGDAPASAHYLLAEANLACNRPTAALQAVAMLINKPDADPVALLIAARAHLAADRLDEAHALAPRMKRAAPDSADVHLLCAYLALKSGRAQEAIDDVERSLRLNADRSTALCLKGQAQEAAGQFEDARQTYLAAVEADPTMPAPQKLLSRLAERLGASPASTEDDTVDSSSAVSLTIDPCFEDGEMP